MATPKDGDSGFPHAMGRPARGALEHAGYTRLDQLDGVAEQDLLALHGVGPKAIRVLRAALEAEGLSFGPRP